ncbi:CHAP domain-containing protein [Patescibacteria group bacterium]
MLKWILKAFVLSVFLASSAYATYPYDSVCPGGYEPYADPLVANANIPGGIIFESVDYWEEGLDDENHFEEEDDYWVDQWRFAQCNCTSYVAYRLNGVSSIGFDNQYRLTGNDAWGDGRNWGAAADLANISRDDNPLPGDVAYWDKGTWGHVAFVEKVNYDASGNATSVYVTEYNYSPAHDLGNRTIQLDDEEHVPNDFIHILGHEYVGLICSDHASGRRLCWSYSNGESIACSDGESHFFEDRDLEACYSASVEDCSDALPYTAVVAGGRGGGLNAVLPGHGLQSDPDPNEEEGLVKPDFIVEEVQLKTLAGEEKYIWSKTEELYTHAWFDNEGDADWEGSHNSVEVRYYLSQGLKEDLHSEWERIGIDYIQKENLEINDSPKHEDDRLILLSKESIQPGNFYNIVACIDRTVDQYNGMGDVDEIHESDNCSTETVFYVSEESSAPPMTDAEVMSIINLILD